MPWTLPDYLLPVYPASLSWQPPAKKKCYGLPLICDAPCCGCPDFLISTGRPADPQLAINHHLFSNGKPFSIAVRPL